MKLLSARSPALALVAGLVAGGPAIAAEYTLRPHFGWLSIGTNYTISEGHILSLGEFSGSSVEPGAPAGFDVLAWQCPASFDVNFPAGRIDASGYCVVTQTSGDSFHLKWTCVGDLQGATGAGPLPFGPSTCLGEAAILGGTGALAGITSENTFEAVLVLFHPDGKASGYTTNEWKVTIP